MTDSETKRLPRWWLLESVPADLRWYVAAVAAVTAFLALDSAVPDLFSPKTASKLSKGRTIDATITLVTADITDLACASNETTADGARCLFDADGKPRPEMPPGEEAGRSPQVLAPYMTVDNVLFLIPGLWAEPAIAARFQKEPPAVPRDQLSRFNAKCKLQVVGKMRNFAVRWEPTASFGHRDEAWVGKLSDCSVVNW